MSDDLPPNYTEGEGLAMILAEAADRVAHYQGVNVPPLLRRAAAEIRRQADEIERLRDLLAKYGDMW